MSLKRHLAFVQDLLYSRQDITIEDLFIEEIEPEQAGIIEGRLRFLAQGLNGDGMVYRMWDSYHSPPFKPVNPEIGA